MPHCRVFETRESISAREIMMLPTVTGDPQPQAAISIQPISKITAPEHTGHPTGLAPARSTGVTALNYTRNTQTANKDFTRHVYRTICPTQSTSGVLSALTLPTGFRARNDQKVWESEFPAVSVRLRADLSGFCTAANGLGFYPPYSSIKIQHHGDHMLARQQTPVSTLLPPWFPRSIIHGLETRTLVSVFDRQAPGLITLTTLLFFYHHGFGVLVMGIQTLLLILWSREKRFPARIFVHTWTAIQRTSKSAMSASYLQERKRKIQQQT
ncbi:hypothetical protein DFJ58DRAFT_842822 [Suillus subalutaceus]|uniref:uncharacterized protein n=1 Tax=Suillus subalutaceus TaxID=48586 RepID=UPI001B88307A|nr:uncharacterized protein DFJ58DRAFT_842822 [Suillus subalutaceus]KAG1848712.1 hypothetical protein DFJ58DRAFT_842822 [Suillus subalutaceus]